MSKWSKGVDAGKTRKRGNTKAKHTIVSNWTCPFRIPTLGLPQTAGWDPNWHYGHDLGAICHVFRDSRSETKMSFGLLVNEQPERTNIYSA